MWNSHRRTQHNGIPIQDASGSVESRMCLGITCSLSTSVHTCGVFDKDSQHMDERKHTLKNLTDTISHTMHLPSTFVFGTRAHKGVCKKAQHVMATCRFQTARDAWKQERHPRFRGVTTTRESPAPTQAKTRLREYCTLERNGRARAGARIRQSHPAPTRHMCLRWPPRAQVKILSVEDGKWELGSCVPPWAD